MTPFTWLTGYVCGTPRTITSLARSERMSQTRGSLTALESANASASYEWSRRFRKP